MENVITSIYSSLPNVTMLTGCCAKTTHFYAYGNRSANPRSKAKDRMTSNSTETQNRVTMVHQPTDMTVHDNCTLDEQRLTGNVM